MASSEALGSTTTIDFVDCNRARSLAADARSKRMSKATRFTARATGSSETESRSRLPDILAAGLSVIFCGINPSTNTAQTGFHFASGTNRFWRVLHGAGFTPHRIAPQECEDLLRYGCGLTVAVARPTAGANDLSRQELRQAKAALESKITRYAPRIVAFLGKPAYGAMTGSNELVWGPQPGRFGGAEAWVLPNPSGRNRSFSFEALVHAYSELKEFLDRATATTPRVAVR
jgi:double-stranded uracil-DNA glycosylase